MHAIILLAHFLIGFYFTFFGFWNIYHWASISEVLLRNKIPSPLFILSIAIAWQIIFGMMIICNTFVSIAAFFLIPFTLFIVFILHPFWSFTGQLKKQHMALFITNFTMSLGALLLLLSHPI